MSTSQSVPDSTFPSQESGNTTNWFEAASQQYGGAPTALQLLEAIGLYNEDHSGQLFGTAVEAVNIGQQGDPKQTAEALRKWEDVISDPKNQHVLKFRGLDEGQVRLHEPATPDLLLQGDITQVQISGLTIKDFSEKKLSLNKILDFFSNVDQEYNWRKIVVGQKVEFMPLSRALPILFATNVDGIKESTPLIENIRTFQNWLLDNVFGSKGLLNQSFNEAGKPSLQVRQLEKVLGSKDPIINMFLVEMLCDRIQKLGGNSELVRVREDLNEKFWKSNIGIIDTDQITDILVHADTSQRVPISQRYSFLSQFYVGVNQYLMNLKGELLYVSPSTEYMKKRLALENSYPPIKKEPYHSREEVMQEIFKSATELYKAEDQNAAFMLANYDTLFINTQNSPFFESLGVVEVAVSNTVTRMNSSVNVIMVEMTYENGHRENFTINGGEWDEKDVDLIHKSLGIDLATAYKLYLATYTSIIDLSRDYIVTLREDALAKSMKPISSPLERTEASLNLRDTQEAVKYRYRKQRVKNPTFKQLDRDTVRMQWKDASYENNYLGPCATLKLDDMIHGLIYPDQESVKPQTIVVPRRVVHESEFPFIYETIGNQVMVYRIQFATGYEGDDFVYSAGYMQEDGPESEASESEEPRLVLNEQGQPESFYVLKVIPYRRGVLLRSPVVDEYITDADRENGVYSDVYMETGDLVDDPVGTYRKLSKYSAGYALAMLHNIV